MSRKCKDSPSSRRGCSVAERGHGATLCEKANLLPRSSLRPGTASSDMIQLDRKKKGIEGTFGWLQALATSGHDEPVNSLVPSAVLASTERHDPLPKCAARIRILVPTQNQGRFLPSSRPARNSPFVDTSAFSSTYLAIVRECLKVQRVGLPPANLSGILLAPESVANFYSK